MDIIRCTECEWQDSQHMLDQYDTALAFIGEVTVQGEAYAPTDRRCVYDIEYGIIGYVEE